MALNLLIVESPGKIKKLSAILGPEWRIAASFGHIRDLPETELGIEMPGFKPVYQIPPDTKIDGRPFSKKKIVDNLKTLCKQFDPQNVFLGTDPDREGEAIAWHLAQVLNLKNPRRVTFCEVTENAVNAAIQSPRQIDLNLVYAQEARRCLDRIIGWPVSQYLSKKRSGLSAGRVQSPAVRLVVERERAIRGFKPTFHFGVQVAFQNPAWAAEWKPSPRYTNVQNPYVLDKAFAAKIATIKQLTVQTFKESEEKRSPPPPFNTVTMLQSGSVVYDFSPDYTMKLAQKLNEGGHITYHRTDNPNISEESFPLIVQVARQLGIGTPNTPRKFKIAEAAQVGHPAVTPTHWEVESAGDSDDEIKLYQLIRLRAIASQLNDARYAVKTMTLTGRTGDSMFADFEAKGRTLIYDGWKKLVPEDQSEEKEEVEDEPLCSIPSLAVGASLTISSSKILEKSTRKPPRYTLASLTKDLESYGIGRPATYAAIMKNIFTKKYVQLVKGSKKQIEASPNGELIYDSLVNRFSFVELEYTKYMEFSLDEIASGKVSYSAVMQYFYEELKAELTAAA